MQEARKNYNKSAARRRQSRERAAAQLLQWMEAHCAADFWGLVPVELLVQDGQVVRLIVKGPEQRIKIDVDPS